DRRRRRIPHLPRARPPQPAARRAVGRCRDLHAPAAPRRGSRGPAHGGHGRDHPRRRAGRHDQPQSPAQADAARGQVKEKPPAEARGFPREGDRTDPPALCLYIMSGDMPPGIPPPPFLSSGTSVTIASVVSTIAAIDAAFCSADRVTLAGSTIPASNMLTNLSFRAS